MDVGEQMANTVRAQHSQKFGVIAPGPKFPPLFVPSLKPLIQKGFSRGSLVEVNGRRSSGRTSVVLHILAEATSRGEICALVDLYNSFDPSSAARAGVQLERLVWVRCGGNAEHGMRAADLLLHAGGFGVVLLDLCEAKANVLNRIPFSYWYRFRRAIEHTPTILVVSAEKPQVKGSSSSLQVKRKFLGWSGTAPFLLLRSMEVIAALKATAISPKALSIRKLS